VWFVELEGDAFECDMCHIICGLMHRIMEIVSFIFGYVVILCPADGSSAR